MKKTINVIYKFTFEFNANGVIKSIDKRTCMHCYTSLHLPEIC